MKYLLLVFLFALISCQNDNYEEVGSKGDDLLSKMQDEKNEEKVYIIMFIYEDEDDAALTAANKN